MHLLNAWLDLEDLIPIKLAHIVGSLLIASSSFSPARLPKGCWGSSYNGLLPEWMSRGQKLCRRAECGAVYLKAWHLGGGKQTIVGSVFNNSTYQKNKKQTKTRPVQVGRDLGDISNRHNVRLDYRSWFKWTAYHISGRTGEKGAYTVDVRLKLYWHTKLSIINNVKK